ncbi:MAG: hypothetical protein K2N73_04515 [Lachnospiraceae bacterium]|nr:hypothetical protein [Lachnospiraceae bacterium]
MKKKRHSYEMVPLCIFGGIFLCIFCYCVMVKLKQGDAWLVYSDSLDLSVADVNGQDLTLRDMAFYIAFDEMIVEEQAQIYNAEDTARYWNLKSDSTYIRQLSKQNAMKKAIHDEIFYQMALDEKLELTQEEEVQLSNVQDAFWDNVMDSNKLERLGVTEKDLNDTIRKIGIAQKYQGVYAAIHQIDMEELDIEGEAYEMMLGNYPYQINERVWEKVNYGDITLVHKNGIYQ